jgi:hypothetical protein
MSSAAQVRFREQQDKLIALQDKFSGGGTGRAPFHSDGIRARTRFRAGQERRPV